MSNGLDAINCPKCGAPLRIIGDEQLVTCVHCNVNIDISQKELGVFDSKISKETFDQINEEVKIKNYKNRLMQIQCNFLDFIAHEYYEKSVNNQTEIYEVKKEIKKLGIFGNGKRKSELNKEIEELQNSIPTIRSALKNEKEKVEEKYMEIEQLILNSRLRTINETTSNVIEKNNQMILKMEIKKEICKFMLNNPGVLMKLKEFTKEFGGQSITGNWFLLSIDYFN